MRTPKPPLIAGFSFLAGLAVAIGITVSAQRSDDFFGQSFFDVPMGSETSDAVRNLWMKGVLQGYNDGRFGPFDFVTRGQVALMLYRYDQSVVQPLYDAIQELRERENLDRCGDGFLDSGEQCDDGNTSNNDGCSSSCRLDNDDDDDDGNAGGTGGGGSEEVCYSSRDCRRGDYCTIEDGDCQSACPGSSGPCIQVCTGRCKEISSRSSSSRSSRSRSSSSRSSSVSAQCAPYVCPDGTTHPSCTPDGHVINYFADPCLTHQGSGRSSSSSSIGSHACAPQRANYESTVSSNRTCNVDSDCTVFIYSCPYLTCGTAVRTGADNALQQAAENYVQCQQQSGQPVACAMCAQQKAVCRSGQCVLE